MAVSLSNQGSCFPMPKLPTRRTAGSTLTRATRFSIQPRLAPNTARLFLEYLLSRDANEIMVKFRQDPVNAHVKPLPGGRSIADVKTVRPSYEEIDKGIPEVKELFRDTFGI